MLSLIKSPHYQPKYYLIFSESFDGGVIMVESVYTYFRQNSSAMESHTHNYVEVDVNMRDMLIDYDEISLKQLKGVLRENRAQ